MAQLMLHRNLLKNFSKLPVKVQKRVAGFIDRFQEDPTDPALNVHSLKERMADPKVRGAKLPDGYRAIIVAPEKGDTYLMVHIDTHDEAYAWAKNKHFEIHSMTGVFQMFDVEEIESVADQTNEVETTCTYPLLKFTDDDLFKAGVPHPLIPAVKAIESDEALEALSLYLPPDCRDILMGLSAGMTLDEALAEMLWISKEEEAASPGDFSTLQNKPNYDLVLVEGEEALKEILAASLEEWRVFLHPYQRKLVQWQTNGPMNITGAAGTGKTVAMMHRAAYLANRLEDPKARILVTTFTTNLSITIKSQIRSLCPDKFSSIEVTNLHALARTICSRSGWKGRIAGDDELDEVWEGVIQSVIEPLPMSEQEVKKEYNDVIDVNGIDSDDDYITCVRSGRPRISRRQRRQLWPVFREFQRALKKRNVLTFEGAIHQARLAVEQGNFPAYRHVLVDEVQDFSLEALRLIRSLSPIADNLRDPLCTVGDGHQRIYRRKIPLSRAGINIRGRSRRLKINYRTSEQIRKYAQGMLTGVEIDDLDGGIVSIQADHSVFRGPEPILVRCHNQQEEAKTIVSWVQDLTEERNLATHEICIAPYKTTIREALTAKGIGTFELKPREEDPGSNEPGIRMGTMKRIKGLEFKAVAMACANPEDAMNHLEAAQLLERCERYVVATRARENLLITLAHEK